MSNHVHVVLHVDVKQTQAWSDNDEDQHWHICRWQTQKIETTTALPPIPADAQNFTQSNCQRHIKKSAVHNEKHNGNKGYPIKKFY
jgi:methionine synthase II (cobalamin-independent)